MSQYKLLKATSFIKIIETSGSGPFYCVVEGNNEYYCKKSNLKSVPFADLINEIIGHKILTSWGIPTPEINYINFSYEAFKNEIDNDFERIKELYKQKKIGIKNTYNQSQFEYPVFGSKKVEGTSSLALDKYYEDTKGFEELKKFDNLNDILLIAFFDILFYNKDRKPSNLNLLISPIKSKFQFIPIDHCQLFNNQKQYDFIELKKYDLLNDSSILNSNLYQATVEILGKEGVGFLENNVVTLMSKVVSTLDEVFEIIPEEWGFSSEMKNEMVQFYESIVDKIVNFNN